MSLAASMAMIDRRQGQATTNSSAVWATTNIVGGFGNDTLHGGDGRRPLSGYVRPDSPMATMATTCFMSREMRSIMRLFSSSGWWRTVTAHLQYGTNHHETDIITLNGGTGNDIISVYQAGSSYRRFA